jgi:hypothetical protein
MEKEHALAIHRTLVRKKTATGYNLISCPYKNLSIVKTAFHRSVIKALSP